MQATLNGYLIDDGGLVCTVSFEWGSDTTYGNVTPEQVAVTGATFSAVINGLSPDCLYHFRAKAVNANGTSYGADQFFTTPAEVGIMTLLDEDLLFQFIRG